MDEGDGMSDEGIGGLLLGGIVGFVAGFMFGIILTLQKIGAFA